MTGAPYSALIGGRRFVVRYALYHEEGPWTLVLGDELVPIDEPADLLKVVAEGEKVVADFGPFVLTMWRAEKVWFRASVGTVSGNDSTGDEAALWSLLDRLGEAHAPRACFFCRWSDVEPSTGWGHLGCAVKSADAYDRVATSSDSHIRKWGSQGMLEWVDEWFSCDRFAVRPKGYGYRGRP